MGVCVVYGELMKKVSRCPKFATVAVGGKQWKRRVNNEYKRAKAVQAAETKR